ncbi:MAG: serine aminopeptidase domain-containing protein [Bacteroidia bacterium]|jgi:dienelactone hydrolase
MRMCAIKLTNICRKASHIVLFVFCTILSQAQQAEEITFSHAGKTVYGTFCKPAATGVFPTIIINSGSGANDRNGTVVMVGANVECLYPGLLNDTLRPYKGLSDALVDSGFAVLRFDKIEYTYSTPTTLGAVTFEKLWLSVESAIDYVKTRNDVDTSNIILIGHSEGSSLIPFIARERNDVKALISLAGPRSPLDSVLAYQLMEIATLCGGNVPQTQMQVDQLLSYFTAIRNNAWNASTPAVFGIPASVWDDYIEVVDSVSINYNLANLPTLFLGLGLDFNVPPSELTRFQNEVTCTDDFWSIPGLIHYMTPNNLSVFSETVSDTIVYWLRQPGILNGLQYSNQKATVNYYPNPFNESLSFTLPIKVNSPVQVSILTMIGREVYRAELQKDEDNQTTVLNLDFLPADVYWIRLQGNGLNEVSKVLKQ